MFSAVVPVLNEEESLRELVEQIDKSFRAFKHEYEIIFVDDGSTDRSLEILQDLEKKFNNIRVFSFRRNSGKSHALMLGFKRAKGDYIVMLDADLQDDPTNIRELYSRLIKGNYDMVTGWRKNRRDNPYKRATSKIFNTLVAVMFGFKIHDLNSGLKLFRAEAAKDLSIYGGMHRFIPVIMHEMGYKVGEKEVIHHKRKYGKSKYKATKVFTDIPDLVTIFFLTKYTRRPLHFFGKIGSILFGLGFIVLIYLTFLRLMGERIGDRPLLIFGVLLVIAGLQTIFTGLLADLIVNINTKGKDDYPIKYESPS